MSFIEFMAWWFAAVVVILALAPWLHYVLHKYWSWCGDLQDKRKVKK